MVKTFYTFADARAMIVQNKSTRNFGLDLCRAIAILSVVFSHMLQHSVPPLWLSGLSFLGMFGVDLFFCLSGFLIGRILIKESQDWYRDPQGGLLRFWYRRWMRTLPLYFFFLFVWLKWDWQGATTLGEQLPYLLFAQNLAWPMSDFFLLTWSLAVEEWFYYLFPLFILTVIGFGGSARHGVFLAIVGFIVLPFLARILFIDQVVGLENFDEGVRHIVVFRLDSIGFGVVIAYIYCYHRSFFESLAKQWYLFLLLVVICVMAPKLHYPAIGNSPLWLSAYLSLSALAFAGLIPLFNNIEIKQTNYFTRFIQFTSKVSYSMYLGHIIAFIAVINGLNEFGILNNIYPHPWLVYPIFFFIVYFFATATYFGVERPVLYLRDKKSKALVLGMKLERTAEIKSGRK